MRDSRALMAAAAILVCGLGATAAPAADPPSSQEAAESVPLEIRSWKETQEFIAEQKGKVVVVDLWSTACAPCVREFPRLVELHRKQGEDVACISVNLNYIGLKKEPPESLREDVLRFLEKQQATFPNILCSTPDLEVLEKIELASIPAVYVYDRTGKLVRRFDNATARSADEEFTYEKDVLPLVKELLSDR